MRCRESKLSIPETIVTPARESLEPPFKSGDRSEDIHTSITPTREKEQSAQMDERALFSGGRRRCNVAVLNPRSMLRVAAQAKALYWLTRNVQLMFRTALCRSGLSGNSNQACDLHGSSIACFPSQPSIQLGAAGDRGASCVILLPPIFLKVPYLRTEHPNVGNILTSHRISVSARYTPSKQSTMQSCACSKHLPRCRHLRVAAICIVV